MSDLVRLAPDVPDLSALGAQGLDDFLAGCRGLATADRAQVVARREDAFEHVRVPLPGTTDAAGRRHELPRGAGTGWLRVRAWRSGAGELLRARLAPPRSTSAAARRWNLACHLLANGVAAPRPLALLERADGLRAVSVLVEGELEGFEPLPSWLQRTPRGATRERGLRALGLAVNALLRAGAWLPGARAADVLLADPEAPDRECAASTLASLRRQLEQWRERGLVRARLPAVAFAGLDDGRLRRSLSARRSLAWVQGLADALPPGARLTGNELAALRQACIARATASDSATS